MAKKVIRLTESTLKKIIREVMESEWEPTNEDWDDVMFDDGREEPDLENDEMGNYYNRYNRL